MSVEDASQTRLVQRELGRRCIDISMMDIHAHHGVVTLRGTAKHMRGHEDVDIAHEIHVVCQSLRQKGFREIVNEVIIR